MYHILDEDLNKYEIFDLSELLCYWDGVTHFYYPITFKSNNEIVLNNNFLIVSDLHKAIINYKSISVIKEDDFYLYNLDINFFEMK
jgi:hypothetical protein